MIAWLEKNVTLISNFEARWMEWGESATTPATTNILNAITIKTECQQLYDESFATEKHHINCNSQFQYERKFGTNTVMIISVITM